MDFRFLITVLGLGVVLGAPTSTLAQLCTDDDAGAVCEDDAGALDDDGGVDPPDAGSDAGPSGPDAACSCDAYSNAGGDIHVCTGSFDLETCRTFTCERGVVHPHPCSTDEVELCCEMPDRNLYANLYADCTHANCRAGFIAQCKDFDGFVHDGACREQLEYEMRFPDNEDDFGDDDDGGWCSVAQGVGAGATGSNRGASAGLPLLGAALGLLLVRRRRRRVAAR